MIKRAIGAFIICFILLSFLASAVQVVEVQSNEPKEEPKATGWKKVFSFLKSPLFWGIVIAVILLFVVLIGLVFLIKWLIQFFKSRKDIYLTLKKDRILMAKIHRSYGSKHWWKIEKNIPIRLVRVVQGKNQVSKPICYHRGDYTTHEGNICIATNFPGRKKFLIFPETDLIIIPDKPHIDLEQTSEEGKRIVATVENLPRAKDIVQFNENEILIYADSISKYGHFFIPVLKASDNTIIDLSLPVYATLRHVVLGEFLFEQSSDFVAVTRKAVDMNPSVRIGQKLADQNQNVDVQTEGAQP